jgi:outer membrane lipoprotein-sorting protein
MRRVLLFVYLTTILFAFVSDTGKLSLAQEAKNKPAQESSEKQTQQNPPTQQNTPVKLSEEELGKLLDTMEKNLESLKTLKTDFVQEKYLSLFSDVVTCEGFCLFMRPDKVRFEITKPFQSVLVANGKSVAKYEFSEGSWKKLNVRNTDVILAVTGQIASWLQGKFGDKSGVYEISAVRDENTTIILTPKKEELKKHISAIELTVPKGERRISQVIIREPEKDYTVLKFSGEKENVELKEKIFDTTGESPSGVSLGEKKEEIGKTGDSVPKENKMEGKKEEE